MRNLSKICSALFIFCVAFYYAHANEFDPDKAVILQPVGSAPVVDRQPEYAARFCALLALRASDFEYFEPCHDYIHKPSKLGSLSSDIERLPVKIHLLAVPGIFSQCRNGPVSLFENSFAHIASAVEEGGLDITVTQAPVTGYSSSEENADIIRQTITEIDLADDEKLVILGFSKGVADSLVTLQTYPALAEKVSALLSIGGVVMGSPLADNAPELIREAFSVFPSTCKGDDGEGIASLTHDVRSEWMAEGLPDALPYYSIAGVPGSDRTSTILIPAKTVTNFVSPHNDSQVVYWDAIIPGGNLLGFVKADHWALARPFVDDPNLLARLIDKNEFPREIMIEAALRLIADDLAAKQ